MMPQSSILQAALAYILRNEGGYVNNVADRGGPTNFGITLDDLSEYRKTPVGPDSVKYMTTDEAQQIYWEHYLKPMAIDQLTAQPIAICLADTGVLYGPGTAIHYGQQVCNGYGYQLNVDGMMGPKTIMALNSVNPELFIKDYHGLLLVRIAKIITDDLSQEQFKKGWMARADRLLTLTKENA